MTSKRGSTRGHWTVIGLLWLYQLSFTWTAALSYFTNDDLSNLFYYRLRHLPWESVWANLTFWSSFRRPLGGVVYTSLHALFGLNPLPYYSLLVLLALLNTALAFRLIHRISGRPLLAALTAAAAAVHPGMIEIWFEFGAVYESLALLFMLLSFHLWADYRDNPSPLRYGAALGCFVLALNGKEMAVSLPALLLLFELLRRNPGSDRGGQSGILQIRNLVRRFGPVLLKLSPFVVITALYTLGKVTGAESYWSENPLYRYRFDATAWRNLQSYLEILTYYRVEFGDLALAALLAATLAAALLLRNGYMIFGWAGFLITLAPVLALPRVWGLFLYIPLLCVSLYGSALVLDLLGLLVRRRAGSGGPLAPALQWSLLVIALLLLAWLHLNPFLTLRRERWDRSRERESFARQLFDQLPGLPPHAWLVVEAAPIPAVRDDRSSPGYELHFLVWLHYQDTSIRVFRSFEQTAHQLFLQLDQVPEYHRFSFREGRLERLEITGSELRSAFERFASQSVQDSAPLTRFLVPVEYDPGRSVDAGITVVNPHAEAVILELRLRDPGGRLVHSAQPALAPGERFSWLAGRSWAAVQGPAGLKGVLEAKAERPLLGRGVWFAPAGLAVFPLFPDTAPPSSPIYIPHVAQDANISCSLLFLNPDPGQRVTGTLRLQGRHSRRPPQEMRLDVPAGGFQVISPPRDQAGVTQGWAKAETDAPLWGMAVFSMDELGMSVLPAAAVGRRLRTRLEFDPQSRLSTSLALVNTTPHPARVLFRLQGEGKLQPDLPPLELAPFGQWAGSPIPADAAGPFSGHVEIRSNQPLAAGAVRAGIQQQSALEIEELEK